MSVRSSLDPFGGRNPLVDKQIGDVYPTVKNVSDNLDAIIFVADNIDKLTPNDVELRSNSTTSQIEWRYVIPGALWNELVPFSEISGPPVEMQTTDEDIQYRRDPNGPWENLIAISDITGKSALMRQTGNTVEWKLEGQADWTPLIDFTATVDNAAQAKSIADATAVQMTAVQLRQAQLEAGQQSSALYFATKAQMDAVTGTANQGAFVTSGTGSGQYKWNGTAWEFLRADLVQEKADFSQVDLQWELTTDTLNGTAAGEARFKGVAPGASGAQILYFTAGSMGIKERRGGAPISRTITFATDQQFSVGSSQILIWDFSTNTFKVQNNYDARPASFALLAYNKGGQIVAGLIMQGLQRIAADLVGLQLVTSPWYKDGQITSGAAPISVDLSTTGLFAVSGTGRQLATLAAGTYPAAFSVPANSMLIWDLVLNEVKVYSNNAIKPFPHVVLTNCRTGGWADMGELVEKRNSYTSITDHQKVSTLDSRTKIQYSHLTVSRHQSTLNPLSAAGNVVTATNLTLFAIGWAGTAIKEISPSTTGPITATWTFADNEVLIWDWVANSIRKIGNNDARPAQFITLLFRKQGVFYGELLPSIAPSAGSAQQNILVDSVAESTESRAIMIPGKFSGQGFALLKDVIWSFDQSNAEHTDVGKVVRYKAELENSFPDAGGANMTHNFGHVATADYNFGNDVLLMGNGESSPNVLPRLDLLLNASSYGAGAFLDFNNQATTPRVSIEFFVRDGSGNVIKQLGGPGAVACWGEAEHIVYMLTGGDNYTHRIFKVVLGMGANNFSDSTGTDLTRWGTFISGKTDAEYNGTAKVLQIFTGKEYNISQGLCFHDGKLFYGVTSTTHTTEVIEVSVREDSTFRTTKKYRYNGINKAGGYNDIETEDIFIIDGRYLMVSARSSNPWTAYFVLFPLYNEMGGRGKVGVEYSWPFKVNSIPQIQITPVGSGATDLRATTSRTGFRVDSASGGSGDFNWSARIS